VEVELDACLLEKEREHTRASESEAKQETVGEVTVDIETDVRMSEQMCKVRVNEKWVEADTKESVHVAREGARAGGEREEQGEENATVEWGEANNNSDKKTVGDVTADIEADGRMLQQICEVAANEEWGEANNNSDKEGVHMAMEGARDGGEGEDSDTPLKDDCELGWKGGGGGEGARAGGASDKLLEDECELGRKVEGGGEGARAGGEEEESDKPLKDDDQFGRKGGGGGEGAGAGGEGGGDEEPVRDDCELGSEGGGGEERGSGGGSEEGEIGWWWSKQLNTAKDSTMNASEGAEGIERTPSFWMGGRETGAEGDIRNDLDLADVLVEAGRVYGMVIREGRGRLTTGVGRGDTHTHTHTHTHNGSSMRALGSDVVVRTRKGSAVNTSVVSNFLNIQHYNGGRNRHARDHLQSARHLTAAVDTDVCVCVCVCVFACVCVCVFVRVCVCVSVCV